MKRLILAACCCLCCGAAEATDTIRVNGRTFVEVSSRRSRELDRAALAAQLAADRAYARAAANDVVVVNGRVVRVQEEFVRVNGQLVRVRDAHRGVQRVREVRVREAPRVRSRSVEVQRAFFPRLSRSVRVDVVR